MITFNESSDLFLAGQDRPDGLPQLVGFFVIFKCRHISRIILQLRDRLLRFSGIITCEFEVINRVRSKTPNFPPRFSRFVSLK